MTCVNPDGWCFQCSEEQQKKCSEYIGSVK